MTRYIQSWKLDTNQTVHISKNKKITFRHRTNNTRRYRGVSLSIAHLDTIKDFADFTKRHNVKIQLPLDNQVWIQNDSTVKLYVCSCKRKEIEHRFFRFSDVTWRVFINNTLPDILSFLKDGRHLPDNSGKPNDGVKRRRKPTTKRNREKASKSMQVDNHQEEVETYDEFTTRPPNDVNMEEIEERDSVDYPILS